MANQKTTSSQDVPGQVFGEFLRALQAQGMSADLIGRLQKTLVDDKAFSERALRDAVLSEEQKA